MSGPDSRSSAQAVITQDHTKFARETRNVFTSGVLGEVDHGLFDLFRPAATSIPGRSMWRRRTHLPNPHLPNERPTRGFCTHSLQDRPPAICMIGKTYLIRKTYLTHGRISALSRSTAYNSEAWHSFTTCLPGQSTLHRPHLPNAAIPRRTRSGISYPTCPEPMSSSSASSLAARSHH